MYKTCPKCGYQRQPDDSAPKDICPACELVFSKYLKNLVFDRELAEVRSVETAGQTWQRGLKLFFSARNPESVVAT